MKTQVLQLRKVYANFEEFLDYDALWGIANRLGYLSAKTAWRTNPKYVIDLRNNALIKLLRRDHNKKVIDLAKVV